MPVNRRRCPDKLHCRFPMSCLFRVATMLNRPFTYLSLNTLCVALGCVATVLGAKATKGTCRAKRGGKPHAREPRQNDYGRRPYLHLEGPESFPVDRQLDINRTTNRCLRMRKLRNALSRSVGHFVLLWIVLSLKY